MADKTETTEAPKRKRAAFTRTPKPIYMLVARRDDEGNLQPFDVNAHGLEFQFERDTDKVLEIVSDSNGAFKPIKVTIPVAEKKAIA